MLAIGDIAERCLRFVGLTKDRFQAAIGKQDCGCSKRQAAMNEWGYRWQHWLLALVWVPVLYRIEMISHRIRYGRLGFAAMHLRSAIRVLLFGR